MTELTLRDLDPASHTTFSFYDFMPGEGFRVRGAPDAALSGALAGELLQTDLLTAADPTLDLFAALLLTHGAQLQAAPEFERLAAASARGFAFLLGNESQRPRRMRLARLSLMLRVILDRKADLRGVVGEETLACKSPWDCIDSGAAAGRWAVSCDEDNLRRLERGRVAGAWRAGLPTQIDALGDRFFVGSHYTDGGHILSLGSAAAGPQLKHVAHSCPIVLMFDAAGERMALDAAGVLWQVLDDSPRRELLRLGGKVHRARVIGSRLYAFDWSQAGVCTEVDLGSFAVRERSTGDILVCNDICGRDGVLWGICKLQGRVFKMDADWQPLGSRLGAGSGPGRLLDPIMIRTDGADLVVLNWFSGKLVRLHAF
jgi:hypothetical protein